MNSDMLTWLLAAEIIILALVFVGFFYFMSGKGKTKEREAVSDRKSTRLNSSH